jgi:hypothetical protein
MPRLVSERVGECLRRAAECEERARVLADPNSQEDFRRIARNWHHLAQSYQFSDQIDEYLDDISSPSVRGPARLD